MGETPCVFYRGFFATGDGFEYCHGWYAQLERKIAKTILNGNRSEQIYLFDLSIKRFLKMIVSSALAWGMERLSSGLVVIYCAEQEGVEVPALRHGTLRHCWARLL